jgi:hypothetical protein
MPIIPALGRHRKEITSFRPAWDTWRDYFKKRETNKRPKKESRKSRRVEGVPHKTEVNGVLPLHMLGSGPGCFHRESGESSTLFEGSLAEVGHQTLTRHQSLLPERRTGTRAGSCAGPLQ